MKIFQLINKNLVSLLKSPSTGKKNKQPKVITISREMGSGGRPIAYLVEKKLGKDWKVYHKEIIEKIAKQAKLEKALIKEIDERRVSLIDELIGDIFGRRYPSLNTYYKHLIKVVTEIGQRGNAIIVGRGAEYILPHALKVRVICEMEQRIKWEIEFEKLSRDQAINRIKKSDDTRSVFIQTVYKHDPRKAHHYDLVIRTGPNLSIEDAAELIVRAAKRRFKI